MLPCALYGESIFVTCRVENGLIINYDRQMARLKEMSLTYYFVDDFPFDLEAEVPRELANKENGALRISVYLKKRDSFVSTPHSDGFLITTNFRPVNLQDNKLWRLKLVKRVQDPLLDTLKVGSYGKELFLKRSILLQGYDDVLFYGEGKVFETTTANIFFEKEGKLYTPKSGIYKGLTRETILKDNSHAIEKDIDLDFARGADSAFICNSLFEKRFVSISFD